MYDYITPSAWATIYSQPEDHQLTGSSLLTTIPTLKKQWRVTHQFKPTLIRSSSQSSLHLTIGGFEENYGDRTPCIAISGANMYIKSAIDGVANGGTASPIPLVLDTWMTIDISQELDQGRFMFRILIDGEEHYSVENTQPQDFNGVKVYAASPWRPAQQGFIKRLVIQTRD